MGPPGERGGPARTASPQPQPTKATRCPDRGEPSSFESAPLSVAERAVLELVRDAARTGALAPTSVDIADAAGVESLSTPTAILRRLQLRGLIFVESFNRGRRIWLPDGRATAPVSCRTPPWRWRHREAAHG
jgi:hypothetical protein